MNFESKLKEYIGEDSSDRALELLECYKQQFENVRTAEEVDKAWREKYKQTFFTGVSQETETEAEESNDSYRARKFEDLFNKGE